jgi:amino acid transporter
MTIHSRAHDKRNISFWGAVSIGVGGMVGGGIFAVLGLAVMLAGGAAPLSFLIAGVVALLTAYSYAKLSVAYPNQGGTIIFVDKAFGIDLFTGSLNNLLWLSYIVTLSLYAVAFANYAATLFTGDNALLKHLLISGGILLPTILNLTSASLISRTETGVVAIKIAILVLVVVFGFTSIDTSRIAPDTWGAFLPVVGGAMIMFVAYEGFELIANTAPKVVNYKVTLPRAYYASVLFVILLYVLIAVVTVGALTPDQVVTSADFALAEAAKPSLGQLGFTLVAVSAVLATFSAINATLYGSARLAYSIAEEDELPAFLEKKFWNQPVAGLLLTTVLALLLANLADLSSISTMGSAGFLVIFATVNAANVLKANETGSSRIIAGLGVAACLFALAALIWHTLQNAPGQLWVLAVMVGIAFVVEALYFAFRARERD